MFLSLAIGAFVSTPLAATFARRYGPRWVVTTGMVLEAVGILAVSLLISTTLDGLMLFIPLFVYGIGVGFATAQLTTLCSRTFPSSDPGSHLVRIRRCARSGRRSGSRSSGRCSSACW